MFHLAVDLQVYLHREAVDFRKGINGLAALVEQSLQRDPFARAVYAFSNRRRDRVKLLLWDRNGFWLLTKRLEADRFMWPRQQAVLVLISTRTACWRGHMKRSASSRFVSNQKPLRSQSNNFTRSRRRLLNA